MSNEPRYPDLNEKSLGEQVAELKDYIVNLHRYIRYKNNNVDESNLTRTFADQIHTYVDSNGVIHVMEDLGFDSQVGFYDYVVFNNLVDGTTTISGGNIQTGTIDAQYISLTGLTIHNEDTPPKVTLAIDQHGDIMMDGILKADSLIINGAITWNGYNPVTSSSVAGALTREAIVDQLANDATTPDGIYSYVYNGQKYIAVNASYINAGTIDTARLDVNTIISTGDLATQSDIPDVSQFITAADLPDLSSYLTDAETTQIYKSAVAGTISMAKPGSVVTDDTGNQNTWTTKRPQYDTGYPVLFTCLQFKKTANGATNYTWSTPVKDDTTTVIDGGHITTGTIDAARLNVADIISSGSIAVIGQDLSDFTNDSGYITSNDIPEDLSDFNNDTGFITSNDIPPIPENTSDLNNDSGFITSNDLPDVSGLIKATVSCYYRSTTQSTPTINSSTSIGTSATTDNAWEYVMPRPKRGCYFYTCERYTFSDNSVDFSDVREIANASYTSLWCSSSDATYIDGGKIYANSVTATQVNVQDIISTGSIIVAGDDISDLNNDTGFITSSSLPTNLSDLNNDTGFITDAVDSVILVYKSAVSGTSTMEKPSAEVTNSTGDQNTWTTVRPQYSSSYPVLFVCWQTKLVSGTVSWTTPAKDETTTVIDGGHITTGTIDASQVTVTNIDADEINTGHVTANYLDLKNLTIKDSQNNNTLTIDSNGNFWTSGTVENSYVDTVNNIDTKISIKDGKLAWNFRESNTYKKAVEFSGFDWTNNGGVSSFSIDFYNYTDYSGGHPIDWDEIGGIYSQGGTSSPPLMTLYSTGDLLLQGGNDPSNKVNIVSDDLRINNQSLEDFVVDEGTSNAWYYRIWNSGRMECWRRFSKTATAINTSSGSLYTTSGNTTFDNYPYNFSAAPTVNMSLESAQGLMLAVTGTGSASTPPNIKVMRTAAYNSSTTFYVDVHASGMKASS